MLKLDTKRVENATKFEFMFVAPSFLGLQIGKLLVNKAFPKYRLLQHDAQISLNTANLLRCAWGQRK